MNEEQLNKLRIKQEQTRRVLNWAQTQREIVWREQQQELLKSYRREKINWLLKLKKSAWLFREFCYSIYKMNDMKETIFEVTFTNGSTVFIKAMDKEHAKRIVERNGTEWLSAELTVEMIIDKIEEAKN